MARQRFDHRNCPEITSRFHNPLRKQGTVRNPWLTQRVGILLLEQIRKFFRDRSLGQAFRLTVRRVHPVHLKNQNLPISLTYKDYIKSGTFVSRLAEGVSVVLGIRLRLRLDGKR